MLEFKKTAESSAQRLGWGALFGKYDDDGSGELDQDEFVAAVRGETHLAEADIGDQELKEMFGLIDKDQGGTISGAEFYDALSTEEEFDDEMTFEAFMMSIFELADVWTMKPTKKQYLFPPPVYCIGGSP